MDYAHSRGVIHRDLKPANILVPKTNEDRTGLRLNASVCNQLKITDFGLAKRIDSELHVTQANTITGTPSYMAPEQADPSIGPPGPGCDIYSLGVILYELLTGRVPLEGETSFDTLTLVCTQEPVPLRQLQPRIPLDLETICLKCLHKEPSKRYASAAALAEDLRRFRDGKTIVARPTPAWERTVKWARRQPAVAGLLLLVLLSTTLGFSGVLWQWRSSVEDRNQALTNKAQADIARDRAESNVYFSRVSQARLEWQLNHNPANTDWLLRRCTPEPGEVDRRGWEWHLLRGLTNADLYTLQGHSGGYLEALAFSPDGQMLASAGGGNPYWVSQGRDTIRPGEVVIWDLQTGTARRVLSGFTNQVLTVAFCPDSKCVAAAGFDSMIQIWDAKTGELAMTLDAKGPTRSLAFSPDGRQLVSSQGKNVIVWQLASRQPVQTLQGHMNLVNSVAYSADGRWLASGSGEGSGEVKVWDAQSGEEKAQFAGAARSVAFSPDSRRLAAAGLQVNIWDLNRSEPLRTFGVPGTAQLAVAFRPDGLELATASTDRTVRLWDPNTGGERGLFSGHRERARSVAYHPAGYMLGSGDEEAVIKLWDLTRPTDYVVCGPATAHCDEALAFTPDSTGLQRLPGGGGLSVYDAGTGQRIAERPLPFADDWRTPAALAAFSGDGRWLAGLLRGKPEQIRMWEAQTGQPRVSPSGTLTVHPRYPLYRLALDRTGEKLAAIAVEQDDTERRRALRVWDLAQDRLLLDLHLVTGPVRPGAGALALSPDGKLVAYDDDSATPSSHSQIRVVQVKDGQTRALLEMPDRGVLAVTFSPDGRYLAGGSLKGKVQVWDTERWQALYAEPNQAQAFNLAFDPKSRLLAGASREELKIWDVVSGQTVLVLHGTPPRPSDGGFTPQVSWSPDGRRLALSNWDGTASIWDAADRAAPDVRQELRRTAERRAFAWHAALAEAAPGRDDNLAFTFHWRHLRTAEPFDVLRRRERGRLYARLGQLPQALADFDYSFSKQPPADVIPWYTTACLHALCGQRARALELVRESRRVFVPGALPTEISQISTLWSILEDPEADTAGTLAMLKAIPKTAEHSPSILFTKALACYRAGQFDDAVRLAEDAYDKGSARAIRPLPLLVQALAWQAQDKGAEARQQLVRVERWIDQRCEGQPDQVLRLDVYDGLTFLLLLQEARTRIRPSSERP